jgi:hypothetical protein
VVRRQALGAGDIQQHPTTHQRFESVDTMDSETYRCLDA